MEKTMHIKNYVGEKNLPIIVNQLKQYIKNEKQFLFFTNKKNFPSTGKVSNFYVDESTDIVYRYNPDESDYYIFFKPYSAGGGEGEIITTEDDVILNCGGSDELIIVG